MMTRHILHAAFVTFTISACDEGGRATDDDARTGIFQGQPYLVFADSELTQAETSLQGSGRVGFKAPLKEINAAENYQLTFRLDDRGRLILVTHALSTLEKGIALEMERQGTSLVVMTAIDEAKSEGKLLEGIDASADIQLTIDVHNDEDPAHIFVWSQNAASFSEAEALLNTAEGPEAPGSGAGNYWGLAIEKATITEARLGSPLFKD